MTPDELFDRLLSLDLTTYQIAAVCKLSIEMGNNFEVAALYINDNILPEMAAQNKGL